MAETHIEGSTAVEEHGKHPNYIGVAIFLGVLTAVEIGVASYLTRSPAKVPMLLLLAGAKGALVALYYMHLRFDSRLFSLFFGSAIFLLAIPFALIVVATIGVPGVESAPAEPQATAEPGEVRFTTTASDFKFNPAQLKAKPGERVAVTLKNTGSVEHTFTLKEANFEARADAGKSATGTFTAPPAGTYTFICSVPGHEQLGMVGKLAVQ